MSSPPCCSMMTTSCGLRLGPAAVVREKSVYISHTDSHKFMLRDVIWDVSDVLDVTEQLSAVP